MPRKINKMKYLALLSILFVSFNSVTINLTVEHATGQFEYSESNFIKRLESKLKLHNIDSLERIYGDFIKVQIEQNRLTEGHNILNKIITNQKYSDTLRILAYKNKAILYGQIDLTKKRNAFITAIELITKKKCLTSLLPSYQLEVAKTYLSQSHFLDATHTLNEIDFKKIDNSEKQVEILGVAGLLYAQMGDTTKAINKFKEAIQIAKKHSDYFGLGTIYSSLGNIHTNKTLHYQRAINFYHLSVDAFLKAGYNHYALGSKTDIGIVYARLQQTDSALYYLQSSYDEAKKIGSTYDQAICAKELGTLYNTIKQPEKALKMCKEAKSLNWENASDSFRSSCALCLSNAYEAANQFDSSLYYYKAYHLYRDSAFSKDEIKELAKFNAELEKQAFISEQDKINLKKDQLLETRKLYIIFISIFALLLVGIFLLIIRAAKTRKKSELIAQQDRIQRQFSQALLKTLENERKRVSIELHDSVGQMLVVASRNIREKQAELVEPLLQTAINEVRTISQGMHPYILEKLGLEDAINHLIHTTDAATDIFIDSEIDLSQSLIKKEQEIHIYRILQELISNSLKHSQSPSMSIEVTTNNKTLTIQVSDKGKGFNTLEVEKAKTMSLGWKTLNERVGILRGHIQVQSSNPHGACVTIKIPSS